MKLQRLAGMGPTAAIVSAVAMLLTLATWLFLNPNSVSGAFGFFAVLFFVLVATVWLGAMAVMGLDIDWMAHPDTHNGRLLASLWLAMAGTLLPALLGLTALLGAPGWVTRLLLCLVGLCAGGFTILHNLEGLRVKILKTPLGWLGILAGLLFLAFWLGVLTFSFALIGAGFISGSLLYAAWAIWLGIELGRKRQPVTALT